MNPLQAAYTGIRNALVTSATVPDSLYDASQGEFKVFANAAAGDNLAPYIIQNQIFGGEINTCPTDMMDTLIRVVGVSSDGDEAEQLAEFIHNTLHRHFLVMPGGWSTYIPVKEQNAFYEQQTIQGVQYHAQGAYYRVRANLLSEGE